MRKVIAILLLVCIGCSLFSQEELGALYHKKIKIYSKTQTAGAVIGASGASLIFCSFLLGTDVGKFGSLNTIFGEDHTNNSIALIGTGFTLVLGGIILDSLASRKVKYYRNKLDGLAFNFRYTPQKKGIALCYRF